MTLEFPDWPLLVAPGFGLRQLVASLVEQVETARVEGPLLLAGCSVGGYIAYDLAEALLAAGRRVGLLAIIDTSVTQTFRLYDDDLTSPTRAGALRRLYWNLVRMAKPDIRGRRLGAPASLDVPVTVFVGRDPHPDRPRPPDLGWGAYCRELRIVPVEGDHGTMFEEPQLASLSKSFADSVAGAAEPAAAPAQVTA